MVTVGITILTSGLLVLSKLPEAILYTVSEGIDLVGGEVFFGDVIQGKYLFMVVF